jgi:phosphoglycolate phosphatase-like HAD superfamily hydrolase
MMKTQSKFSQIDTVIFDMDGVITSERKYWEAGGLTVAEILESEVYLGLNPTKFRADAPLEQLLTKCQKFLPDETILALKNRAINSNWDIAYIVVALHIVGLLRDALFRQPAFRDIIVSKGLTQDTLRQLGETTLNGDFCVPEMDSRVASTFLEDKSGLKGYELMTSLNDWLAKKTGIAAHLFNRGDEFWKLCQDIFQEWYLGDGLFETTYGRPPAQKGKIGLIQSEVPILALEQITGLLKRLCAAGYTLGIGTGRPYEEIITPLRDWGLLKYFDSKRISTHREVEWAERSILEAGIRDGEGRRVHLSKPHPFVFLRAIHPGIDDIALYREEYPAHKHTSVAVVGDTVSDIKAAKQIKCLTIAVLTGIGGTEARPQLATAKPDLFLDDVLGLSDLFGLEIS